MNPVNRLRAKFEGYFFNKSDVSNAECSSITLLSPAGSQLGSTQDTTCEFRINRRAASPSTSI